MNTERALADQIAKMVANHEDYIVGPVGIDTSKYAVINFFDGGVWLCEHHGECNIHKFTKVERLA